MALYRVAACLAFVAVLISASSALPARQLCYSCDFLQTPEQCHHVIECQEDEICYTQKYMSVGQPMYRVGCLANAICAVKAQNSTSTQVVGKRTTDSPLLDGCTLCCSNDRCNKVACTATSVKGVCPSSSGIGICVFNPERNCLSDSVCPSDYMCCPDGCGRVCKHRNTGAIYTGRLSNNHIRRHLFA